MIIFTLQAFPQSKEVPFTLEDRDRIIRTEEKLNSMSSEVNSMDSELNGRIESLRNEMDAKFEAVDSKIETLYWGIGIIIALVLFMLGYMIWDRRMALHPVQKTTQDHEERLRKLEYLHQRAGKKRPGLC